ncbi:unnamed protein product [Dimorphilus gyrociliatus]|uniref:PPM-type phosphatase domain-containing protein n=1 Tax=Dimorphilus gyrociliatus TaxID=2664684 RepID=A0A7I8VDZ6_9ANNE|nr:unnamed protein product [Dimorphilus gyrociliatus]
MSLRRLSLFCVNKRCFCLKANRLCNRRLGDPENRGDFQPGVNFDTLGSWNNRLNLELHLEQSIKSGRPIPRIQFTDVGHATLLGRRKTNEDRMCISRLSNRVMMFAIFDGHSGSVAAQFAAMNLPGHIRFWLNRCDMKRALKHAFLEFDNRLSWYLNRLNISCGTTATVCILKDNQFLYVAHIGDSLAVLNRKGSVVRLTREHSPDNPAERERIESKGGRIVSSSVGGGRVQGRLAMSRCFGDPELKFNGIIADPDIKHIRVKHGFDAFLVLATDGVSYALNDQEIIDIVSSCQHPNKAAQLVTDQALHFGSEDNSSALVVPLGAWGKYACAPQAIVYSFGKTVIGNRY